MRPRPPRPPRRLLIRLVALTVGAAVIAALALRDTSPVGHFTSTEARDRFLTAYDAALADLPAPDATLDLRTDFGVVRVYRFDGPTRGRTPLVLLPGRSSGSPVWADNLPSLLELGPVYTVDLLGEPGRSIQDRPIRTDDDAAQWLHEAIVQLPEPRVHLVGLSIGGWTAANLAVRQPDRIAGVTLIDPVLVFSDLAPSAVVRSIPASVRWLPRAWRDAFGSWTANDAPVADVPVARMIEAGMQGYAQKLPAPTRITPAQLAGLDLPVLVIIAGASRMHDPFVAAETARSTLRRGTVLTYPGASHAVNGEQPGRIAADLARFLDA